MPSKCHVCNANATTQCGKCRATWYCGKEHQIKDWELHKSACFPIIIKSDKKMGRHLVSSRDIKAGEIIIQEIPMLISPSQFTKPICLVCTKQIDGSYTCPKCNWPMCGSNCQNSKNHIPECTLTKTNGGVNVKNFDLVHPLYEFIAPLRCLWTRDGDNDTWKKILMMESHAVERKDNGKAEKDEHMKKYLCLDNFLPSEVMHACGVIEVNSFEIPNTNKIALFEKVTLLSHSCYPNTYKTFNINEEVVIRASMDIPRNEKICISYIDTVYGVLERQYLLKSSKYFQCECVRCKDPTEFGSHLNSLSCRNCKSGFVFPPLSDSVDWMCKICGKTEDPSYIVNTLTVLGETVQNVIEKISSCENFLEDSKKYLSENHYLRIDVKIRLLILYGSQGSWENENEKKVSEEEINRKIKLGKELLLLADVIAPGYNLFKGLILSEIQNALLFRYQNQKKNTRSNKKRIDTLTELQNISPEILTIYLEDSIVPDERDIVETAKKILCMIEKGLTQLKS